MANNGIEPTTSNKALMEITTSDIDEQPEDNHEDSSDTIKKVMEKEKHLFEEFNCGNFVFLKIYD